jgi:hypothetical protein
MTDTGRTAVENETAYAARPRTTGTATDDRSGWISFAGAMMIMLGGFQIIEGLVSILRPAYYLIDPAGLVVTVSYTGWGWFHLVLGIVVLAVGIGVLGGRTWARAVGVALALLSALANLVFIGAYPMWAIIVIAVDVAVIFALTTRDGRTV